MRGGGAEGRKWPVQQRLESPGGVRSAPGGVREPPDLCADTLQTTHVNQSESWPTQRQDHFPKTAWVIVSDGSLP